MADWPPRPQGHLSLPQSIEWLHLGDATAIDLVQARQLANEAMFAVARGKDPQAEKKAQRSADTFAELADRYRDEYAKKEKTSWKQADYLVRKHLIPRWGKLPACAITRADVKAMKAD